MPVMCYYDLARELLPPDLAQASCLFDSLRSTDEVITGLEAIRDNPNARMPMWQCHSAVITQRGGQGWGFPLLTLVKVDQDAAPASSFDAAPGGNQLVAAEFKITGVSCKTSDDANNDVSITGSNSQVYTSAFSEVADGTNFNSGQLNLSPGQTEVGWVSFQMPNAVSASAVVWTPDSGLADSPVTWDHL